MNCQGDSGTFETPPKILGGISSCVVVCHLTLMAKSKGKKRGGGAAAADAAGGSQSAEPGKVLKKIVAQSGVAESVGTGAPAPSAKRRKQSRDVGSVSGGTAPPSAAHPTPTATTKTTKSKNKKKKKKNTNTKVSDGAGAGAGAAADDAGTGLASVFAAVSSGPQLVAASTLDDAAAEAAAVAAAAAAAKQKKEKDADAKRRGKFSFAGDVEPEERLKRTLFVGNVAVSVSAKLVRARVGLALSREGFEGFTCRRRVFLCRACCRFGGW